MDWIHCSQCFTTVNKKNHETFSISSCGKLFCSPSCVVKGNLQSCTMCPTCQTITLQEAPQEVTDYFTNLEDMFEKFTKTYTFQSNLRASLENNCKKKYNELRNEYTKLRNYCVDLQKDHKRLRDLVKETMSKPKEPPKPPSNPSIRFSFNTPASTPRNIGSVSSVNHTLYRVPQGYSSNVTTPGSYRSIPSSYTSYASPVELLSNFARNTSKV